MSGKSTPSPAAWQPLDPDNYWTAAKAADIFKEIGIRDFGRLMNVFLWFTSAQLADVRAYTFTQDVTTAVQTAITATFGANVGLELPPGGYKIDAASLTLPGTLAPDTRARRFVFVGAGGGIPYSNLNNGATVLKSVSDRPILTDPAVTLPNAVSTHIVEGIRFDGTSTTPVVYFHSLYGQSRFTDNIIYQRGIGDGFKCEYNVTSYVTHNYAYNRDYVTTGLGAARVGVGFNFPQGYGGGLPVVRDNSARGFKDGYIFSGTGAPPADNYSPEIHHNEASTVYNGMTITSDVNAAWITNNYFEGGDGGTAIINTSDFCNFFGNLIFAGFLTGIDDSSTTNSGSVYIGNTINTGAVVNATGAYLVSSAAFGGNQKTYLCNTHIYTLGTNGVIGLRIGGTDPCISHLGNNYNPRGGWTGTGTKEISDESTNGIQGFGEVFLGARKAPLLSRGVTYLQQSTAVLTAADVVTNVLTVKAGNSHVITPAGAVSINKIAGDVTPGRDFILRMTNNLVTLTNSAFLKLPGGTAFVSGTAGGVVRGIVERVGADNYFYVQSVATFV